MKILVLNCGSSSVKFQVIETSVEMIQANADRTLARGAVEKIGLSDSRLSLDVPGRKTYQEISEILEHRTAVERVLRVLCHPEHGVIASTSEIEAVGHRVVHGGEKFASSVLVTPEVEAGIEECVVLAPLHNPHNLRGLHAAQQLLPNVPHVAVFDTAFHQSMPPRAFIYGLPYELYRRHGIRRYGFHGTSHRFVAIHTARLLGKPLEEVKIVTCHLGNGCSMAAVDRGHSVDTSMGFTPLEGLLMGTRAGDLDPAVLPWVMAMEELTLAQLNAMLNKHSGLYGVSGVSSDMREILDARAKGNARADLAFQIFCYRVRKYLGAYAAAMEGIDAVTFTGGIGENSPDVREACVGGLEFLGIELDTQANRTAPRGEGVLISRPGSRVAVAIIPTNEERVIARDTVRVLAGIMPSFAVPGNEAPR
ncbi:MAG: acetate kinase [Thermoanaerobaculaceae bacterium]|nr:acetate kinase [Thermoanaerobaculaceae bacterium]